MKYEVDGMEYDVIIEKKHNKNLYIRVKDDLKIYVSANYIVSKRQILEVLDNNYSYLQKMIDKRLKEVEKKNHIYYLGKKYDLVISNLFNTVELDEKKIYAPSKEKYEKWYKARMKEIFCKHYEMMYNVFEEDVTLPTLRIRSMKTRWGVCNIKSKTITLNSRLIEYDLSALDYVIIHELSHLVHFNHSKDFWKLVEKYVPDYKKIQKFLKE